MSLVQERQFAVVARVRAGAPSEVSATTIGMDITEQLKQFQTGFTVAYLPHNWLFVVETSSAAFQLQLLSCRALEGEDFVLDLLPWCPEYESADLPWIIAHSAEAVTAGPFKPYMDNLVGQPRPIWNYVSGVLTGRIDEDFRPVPPAQLDASKIYIDMVAARGTMALDLSYMMILELRDLYYEKYSAFVKCRTSCQEISDVAHRFCADLGPTLQDIYDRSQSCQGVSSQQSLLHIAAFGDRVKLEASYAAKELADIHDIICPVFRRVGTPINLSKFKDEPSIYEARGPGYPTAHLRAILNVIVRKFHNTPASVITRATADGNFCTNIQGSTYKRSYYANKTMTLLEAEAVAICRFLRSATHVFGYGVVDQNFPALARLVSDMNKYNEQLAELQTFVDKAVGMIHHVHESVKDVHEMLSLQVPREDIEDLSDAVGELLTCMQSHCMAMDHAFAAFKQDEELYKSLRLETRYAKPPAVASVNS